MYREIEAQTHLSLSLIGALNVVSYDLTSALNFVAVCIRITTLIAGDGVGGDDVW